MDSSTYVHIPMHEYNAACGHRIDAWNAFTTSMGLRYLNQNYICYTFAVVDLQRYMLAKIRYGF
jgi:hypothetical protein